MIMLYSRRRGNWNENYWFRQGGIFLSWLNDRFFDWFDHYHIYRKLFASQPTTTLQQLPWNDFFGLRLNFEYKFWQNKEQLQPFGVTVYRYQSTASGTLMEYFRARSENEKWIGWFEIHSIWSSQSFIYSRENIGQLIYLWYFLVTRASARLMSDSMILPSESKIVKDDRGQTKMSTKRGDGWRMEVWGHDMMCGVCLLVLYMLYFKKGK